MLKMADAGDTADEVTHVVDNTTSKSMLGQCICFWVMFWILLNNMQNIRYLHEHKYVSF